MRGSTLEILPAGAADCAALGLRAPQDLLDLAGGTVVARSRTRSTVRIETASGAVYLKRYWVPTWRHWWRGALRGTWLGRSKARRELRNAGRLRTLGWEAPEALAVAEVRARGALRGCALLTRAVDDAERLDTVLLRMRETTRADRAQLATALGRAVARLHGAGYVDRNLHPRNVLVRWRDGVPTFVKVDSPRGARRGWFAAPAVDLAALDALAQRTCSRADRVRFLRAYQAVRRCGATERRLLRAVARWRARGRRREDPRLAEARAHVPV